MISLLKHRPEKQNANADALSRMPEETMCFMMEFTLMIVVSDQDENVDLKEDSDAKLDTSEWPEKCPNCQEIWCECWGYQSDQSNDEPT